MSNYKKTCIFPGCGNTAGYEGQKCRKHRYRTIPKEGLRVVQVERSILGCSGAELTHKMDVSLVAEPWEVV
ncbi:hypothetical protein PVV74_17260 [Roseovarius sp. SK2]|uniref:hypothetical protein n=1 Tax=Roseovarius TaxID=74030 RepID=UPI00237BF9E0|nr:hypothetical protein [Roseovarius sp. SK2]MDD9727212.1 hypothetical protein [Roseovarius sp. SK2]